LIVVIKNDEFLFPNIITIIKRALEIIFSKDIVVLGYTLLRIIIVILVAFIISLLFTFIYYKLPNSIYFYRPIINLLKASPFAIVSVYIFFAFDRKVAPYIISFLVIFPLLFECLIGAVDNIDKSIKDELALLDISSAKKFKDVYLPICAPYILMGTLQSFGLGIKIMIMSEYICQIENSVGIILVNVKYNYEFDKVLAWLVLK
jgi:NitT/TauT family transport system permease protein